MTEIKVMLSELPPILTEAARITLSTSDDMAFGGEVAAEEVATVIGRGDIDALLLGAAEPAEDDRGKQLLDLNPRLKVVYLSPDGRRAALHERTLQRTVLEEVSLATLFANLRDACAAERIA